MNDKLVDVTIHIDESIDADTRSDIGDRLRLMDGVMAASSHGDKPHLMVVEYDPDKLSSRDILDAVTKTGVHAELIGL